MLTYFAASSGWMNLTEVIAYESAFIYDYLSYLIIVLVTLLVMSGCKVILYNLIDQIEARIFQFTIYIEVIMSNQIEEYYITSSGVESYIFVIPLRYVHEHLCSFRPNQGAASKFVRVCYLVLIEDFSAFIKVQDKLWSLPEYDFYNANLVPFENREQIHEHIKMMEKMNQSQFEHQYVEMLELLEKDIENSLIRDFCLKQLHWSEAKTNKLIQKQEINTISKFLNYRNFNQLESIKINQIWNFIQNSLQG